MSSCDTWCDDCVAGVVSDVRESPGPVIGDVRESSVAEHVEVAGVSETDGSVGARINLA